VARPSLEKNARSPIAITLTLAFWSAVLVTFFSLPKLSMDVQAGAAQNPIVLENQNTGTNQWQWWHDPGIAARAVDTAKQIKGYASATSVNKGAAVTFYVTVNPAPQSFAMKIYRLGWYDGTGGRLMQSITGINGISQPDCPPDPTTGLIECKWTPSYTLTVPTTWTSGIYMVTLVNQNKYANNIIFVVRDDARTADFLYQQSVTTYQAYNRYPNDGSTGKSLYPGQSYGANTIAGDKRAVKVSFDRPYADGGSGYYLSWEQYFVRWLERNGYDVSYSTDIDTHAHPERLLNYKGFLSVGHDEYWSKEMYDGVEDARDRGVSLGFFGANEVYWQIRLEPSSNGSEDRIIVCYKDKRIDPVQGATTTVLWRDPFISRPEQTLVGIMYESAFPSGNAYQSYIIKNSTNWVYDGTGFSDGNSVPGILGYELDRQLTQYQLPASKTGTYVLLSQSPYTDSSGIQRIAQSSIYQAPSGAWVFGAGTIGWSWGLDNWEGKAAADPRIQQTTANILDAFINNRVTAVTPSPTPSIIPTITPTITSTPSPTTTPIPSMGTMTLNATADTYVDGSKPTTAFGASENIYVDSTPIDKAFIKFNLTPLAGKTLKSVKLHIKTTSSLAAGSSGTQSVKYVSDVLWKEQYMTYNNTVSISSIALGTLSNTRPNTYYDINLNPSSLQTSVGKQLSVALVTSSSDELIFYSDETGYIPQLIITYQ